MAYLQNPRDPLVWESDGDPPWGKYKAIDGSFHESSQEAMAHNRETEKTELLEWDSISADEIRKAMR